MPLPASSAESWSRTHRVAGWVFLVGGLLLMPAAAVPSLAMPAIAVMLVGKLGLVVYSYVAWRDDPDKRPPTGRSPA